MPIFVSYSRLDEQIVKSLVQGLESARLDVWFDDDLGGGEVWWVKILESIQQAEVVMFALSDNALQSKPCRAELDYALALNRAVIPIKVGPVANFRANPLSALQTIDFQRDAQAAFEIVGSINAATKRARPLPDPLPPMPPIPYAYLVALSKQIDSDPLSPQAQIDAVDELRKKYREETDPTVRDDIIAILRKLRGKPWATVQAANEVDAVVAWAGGHQTPRVSANVDPASEDELDDAERHSRALFETSVTDRLLVQERERASESAKGEQKPKRTPGAGTAPSEAHREQVEQIKRFDRVLTPLPPPRVVNGPGPSTHAFSGAPPAPAPAPPRSHWRRSTWVWLAVIGFVILIVVINLFTG